MSSSASRVWITTGSPQLAGQGELLAEHGLLDVGGREVVVVVEADLSIARASGSASIAARCGARPARDVWGTWPAGWGCTPIENRTPGQ